MHDEAPATPPRPLHPLVGLGLVALVALVTFRALPDYALIGWDAYPTIDAAAVGSWSDVAGLLTGEFLGGHHPYARFLRPLTSASLALDHGLYGLEPAGYHVTTLVLHAAAAVAVCALARTWFGRGWAPVVGACLFALHPVHWDTLAYVARRGEILALLCGCCALIARERRRPGLAAVLCLLAVLSKETGALFALLVLWRTPRTGAAFASQSAWLSGVVGPYLAYRALPLGGVGGYVELPAATEPLPSILGKLLGVQLTGGAAGALPPPLVQALPWIVGAGLVPLAAIAAWRRRGSPSPAEGASAGTALLGWAGFVVFYAALAPEFNPWYAYLPLAFGSVLLAHVAEHAATELRSALRAWAHGSAPRLTAALSVATLACAITPVLALLHVASNEEDDALFRLASRTQTAYLETLGGALDANPAGAIIGIEPSAVVVGAAAWNPDRRPVMMLGLYSIEAWAHLTRPDRTVHAYGPQTDDPSEAPGDADSTAVQVFRTVVPLPPDLSTRPPTFRVRVAPRTR